MAGKYVCESCGKELDVKDPRRLQVAFCLQEVGTAEEIPFKQMAGDGGVFPPQRAATPRLYNMTPYLPVCYNPECVSKLAEKLIKEFESAIEREDSDTPSKKI